MDAFTILVLVPAGLISLVWVAILILVVCGLRHRQVLHPGSMAMTAPRAPRVSVIVAALNEEKNIEACLRSLLNQDYPDFEVLAIDDRSSDQTPQILRRLKGEFQGKLRVLHIDNLPNGWLGKPHALHQGAFAANGEFFLFTDADCQYESRHALSVSVCAALEERTDLLTITPQFHSMTAVDYFMHPAFARLLLTWFVPMRVNDPKSSDAYANGAFLLIRQECYERVGGFESVRAEISEDVAFAKKVKSANGRLHMADNVGLYTTAAYGTISRARHGYSRILNGSLNSSAKLFVSVLNLVVFEILPVFGLFLALAQPSLFPSSDWALFVALTTTSVAITHLITAVFMRHMGIPVRYSLAHSLGTICMSVITARSLFCSLGWTTISWRGIKYVRVPHGEGRHRALPQSVT